MSQVENLNDWPGKPTKRSASLRKFFTLQVVVHISQLLLRKNLTVFSLYRYFLRPINKGSYASRMVSHPLRRLTKCGSYRRNATIWYIHSSLFQTVFDSCTRAWWPPKVRRTCVMLSFYSPCPRFFWWEITKKGRRMKICPFLVHFFFVFHPSRTLVTFANLRESLRFNAQCV